MVDLGNELLQASFVRREKKFIVYAKLGHEIVRTFLSNTGRLGNILKPGATILLRPVVDENKMAYEVVVGYEESEPVVIDSRLSNLIFKEALDAHRLESIPQYNIVSTEKRVANHRIDFFLVGHTSTYLEVKGCTSNQKGRTVYPDAPTERGREHLKLLRQLQRRGFNTVLVFLAMRSDVKSFKVNAEMDPEFDALLRNCMIEGTQVLSYSTRYFDHQVKLDHRLMVT